MPGYTYIGKLKNSFICDKRLSGNDIRVYLSLKKWDTWEGKVMIETMAQEIGISRKSFSKSIATLSGLKYIKVEKNTNWDCYKYQLHDKAHGNNLPTDGNNLPTDENFLPTNDGKILPSIIIPNNIPNKEKDKKEIPAELNKEAWAEWVQYKKEKKQKLTPSIIAKQIKFLILHKKDHVAIINNSIMNGYTGLFPLNGESKNKPANHLAAEEGKYDGY